MIKYATLNDQAVRFNDNEAWEFVGNEWKELHIADARMKAKLLTEEQFQSLFPHVPALPTTAFQSSGSVS